MIEGGEADTRVTKEEAVVPAGDIGSTILFNVVLPTLYGAGLGASIIKAIIGCSFCKNFRNTHLHALLNPITCCHPGEFLVGDYLSMPLGAGEFHTIGVYLNLYSQHVCDFKSKTADTAKTTIESLCTIFMNDFPAECFTCDGVRTSKTRRRGSSMKIGERRPRWCL